MGIKHGTITAPGDLSLTGALIHEKRTTIEDVAAESMDSDGTFAAGKSIRKKHSFSLRGEGLDTLALPTVGSGAATEASPHVDRSEIGERNEGAADFALDAHAFAEGEGDFA